MSVITWSSCTQQARQKLELVKTLKRVELVTRQTKTLFSTRQTKRAMFALNAGNRGCRVWLSLALAVLAFLLSAWTPSEARIIRNSDIMPPPFNPSEHWSLGDELPSGRNLADDFEARNGAGGDDDEQPRYNSRRRYRSGSGRVGCRVKGERRSSGARDRSGVLPDFMNDLLFPNMPDGQDHKWGPIGVDQPPSPG